MPCGEYVKSGAWEQLVPMTLPVFRSLNPLPYAADFCERGVGEVGRKMLLSRVADTLNPCSVTLNSSCSLLAAELCKRGVRQVGRPRGAAVPRGRGALRPLVHRPKLELQVTQRLMYYPIHRFFSHGQYDIHVLRLVDWELGGHCLPMSSQEL